MHQTALAPLVCPETGAPLTLEATRLEGDDVVEGELIAGERRYPIRDGVPSFVPAETAAEQTVRSFAQKWQKHGYYRTHTADFYRAWYLERYALGDERGLRELLAGAGRVLDAGTGSGRDAWTFLEQSRAPTLVYGVDTAREPLVRLHAELPDARLAPLHADIHRLPFPDEFFDFINCDQVIHHTPEPRVAFERLRQKLRVGGQVCCYVYRKKAVIRELTDDYVRERIQGLGIDEALKVCEGISRLGEAFAKLGATVEIEQDIPVLGIEKGRYDVQRFLHYNVLKCFYNPDFDAFTNNIVNFDWYHPTHCHRFEPEAFRAWFDDGWDVQSFDVREAGMSCRAVKR